MKKFTLSIAMTFMLLSINPAPLKAETEKISVVIPAAATLNQTKAQALLARLDEINAMDKSNLSFKEKRELRKEVRMTQKKLRDGSDGIYISAGAAIIIIILLIILL